MTLRIENEKLFVADVEVTGSHSAASGLKAQEIADFFWPNFQLEKVEEQFVAMMEGLKSDFLQQGLTRDMITDITNYMITAKDKHKRSPKVNLIHINTVVNLLRITRDQMFHEESE